MKWNSLHAVSDSLSIDTFPMFPKPHAVATTELDPVTTTRADQQTLPSTTTIVSVSDMTDFSISLITTTTEGEPFHD